MKITRILVIAVYLLAIFAVPVQASGHSVAFIPLLSNVDPDIPIPIQTQNALRPLLPELLMARQRGDILEFEASMSTGVLKVVHSGSGPGVATWPGQKIFTDMGEAVDFMRLPGLPFDASGAPVITAGGLGVFEMRLFDNCFLAKNLVPNAHLKGSLRDRTGRILAVYDGYADAGGIVSYGCFSWAGSYADVVPGHKLTFQEFDGASLLKTYSVYAPAISFSSIDKANSIVKGTGPAGKKFEAYWFHPLWNATRGAALNVLRTGTINSTKAWSVDFGTVKLRGNDKLHIIVQQNTNFRFSRYMDVPHIYCVLGGNYCEISGFAFKNAAIKIVRGTTAYSYPGKFDAEGYFQATWTNTTTGTPILLRVGDKLSGTGVAQFALPNLTAEVDFATDIVSGKVPPNKYFNLSVRTALGGGYDKYSHSNSQGNYATDFTDTVDLVSDQPISIQIYYSIPTSGNALEYFRGYGP